MVVLYYKIFKAIRERAKKKIGAGAERSAAVTDDSAAAAATAVVVENVAETRRFAKRQIPAISNTTIPMNETAAGNRHEEAHEDEEEAVRCHVIKNKGAGDGGPSSGRRMIGRRVACSPTERKGDEDQRIEVTATSSATNGNPDSGYAPSHIEETQFCLRNPNIDLLEEEDEGEKAEQRKPVRTDSSSVDNSTSRAASACNLRTQQPSPAAVPPVNKKKDKKLRFNLGRKAVHREKTREKPSARLERKATKTLAIVLGK